MTDRLEVRLLGGAAFLLNGQPVKSMPTRAAQALFIYLLHKKYPVERERLIDMFYQTSIPKQAAANFRSTLSRLRKELAPFLIIDGRTVSITPGANIYIDSVHFTEQIETGGWAAALPLYQGDFLDGFNLRDAPEFENWALVERERLRLIAAQGFKQAIAAHQRQGDYVASLQAVNQLLAIEPFLEDLHRTKMLLLTRTGRQAAALQHYTAVTDQFETELGIPLSPETTALYERISHLKTPPPVKLPAATDPFIGRTDEVSSLTRLLAEPERRLITLFGMGGMGKTRLAAETARHIAANNPGLFLDGIHFISFIGTEADDAATAVALNVMQTIGLPLGGPQAPANQAISDLSSREMLLIFDNFEHLVSQHGRFVSRLLQEAPAVKIIATSRERLNLVEETVFDLSGLPLTAPEPLASDAAQLFVTQAQRHQYTFTPAAADVSAIAHTCQLLEGIPLGIELAAGSIRHLTCAEIAQNIQDNLGFLSSSLQNVPARHRSLRAAFLHSWNLLTPQLQLVFANLTTFPAAFDAPAAEIITGAVPAQLDALVDKALLKVANGRYAIHPLLREFAMEQLDGDTAVTLHHKHCDYFATFIADRSQTFHRPTYVQALPDLIAAHDDLVHAWRWAVEQLVTHESEKAWAWIDAMRRPFMRLHFQQNRFHEARALFGAARRRLEATHWHDADAAMHRRLLHAQLTVAEYNSGRMLGDVATAVAPVQAAVPLLRKNVALDDLFDAYNVLTSCLMQSRNFDGIPELLDELDAIAVETHNQIQYGVLYVLRSYYTDFMGDAAGALDYAQQALAAFQALEDTYYEAIVLDGIARRLFTLDQPDEAAAALYRAYDLAEANGQTLTTAYLQKGIAFYHRIKGEYDQSEQALDKSRHLFLAVNDQRNLVEIDHGHAFIAYKRQQWAVMARYLMASLRRAQAQQMDNYILNCVVYLPILQWQRSQHVGAYALAAYLQSQVTLDNIQQQALNEALAMMSDISAADKQQAKTAVKGINLDTIVNTFLREGLRWFTSKSE